MDAELAAAKARLRLSLDGSSAPRAEAPGDIATAKQALRRAAHAVTLSDGWWPERWIRAWPDWIQDSPWQATLTAFLSGAVAGSIDPKSLDFLGQALTLVTPELFKAPATRDPYTPE